jgi:hypothetical protein
MRAQGEISILNIFPGVTGKMPVTGRQGRLPHRFPKSPQVKIQKRRNHMYFLSPLISFALP